MIRQCRRPVSAAGRPRFPRAYGIPAAEDGLLPWSWAGERLDGSRNYWVATTKPDGAPHAMPVWGLWLDGAFVFSTSPESRKGRNLARDPRVVVHVESGEEVVVLEGPSTDRSPARPTRPGIGFDPAPRTPGRTTFRARSPASCSTDAVSLRRAARLRSRARASITALQRAGRRRPRCRGLA